MFKLLENVLIKSSEKLIAILKDHVTWNSQNDGLHLSIGKNCEHYVNLIPIIQNDFNFGDRYFFRLWCVQREKYGS